MEKGERIAVVSLKRPRGGRVTLLDVAQAAGVSKTTASRILDERLPSSETEAAKRVRAVAQELGYTRDIAAASLRRGQTMTIGVIVPRLTDTVMAMLYEAIARHCEPLGRSPSSPRLTIGRWQIGKRRKAFCDAALMG
jgi:hypothetical protein